MKESEMSLKRQKKLPYFQDAVVTLDLIEYLDKKNTALRCSHAFSRASMEK